MQQLTIEEFNALVAAKDIVESDGSGYWAADDYKAIGWTEMDTPFKFGDAPPYWATHVAWYNK